MKIRTQMMLKKTILFSLFSFQILFVTQNALAAPSCKKLLRTTNTIESVASQSPLSLERAEQPGTYARGKLLNTSSVVGLQTGAFELLPNGGMITAKNGAFTCSYCGTPKKITRVPKNPELECVTCGHPMVMKQKQIPPLFVIKKAGQIYAWEHSIVRSKAVVEYFEKEAVACKTCSTIKLEADKSCVNCGDTSNVAVEAPPVREVDFSTLRNYPERYYADLVKMGILNLQQVRDAGIITAKERHDLALTIMKSDDLELYQAINRGLIDPVEAFAEGFITLKQRRRAVKQLIEEGFTAVSFAIEKGWLAKNYAVSEELISKFDADKLNAPGPQEPKGIKAQSIARRHNLGDEDPLITRSTEEQSSFRLPMLKVEQGLPLRWRNLSSAYQRAIKIGVGTLAAAAISGAILFTDHSVETGPIAQGEITHISESLVVYESQAVKDSFEGVRFDIDSPPEGVQIRKSTEDGGILGQIKPIDSESDQAQTAEAVGQIISIMVLEVNGVEVKISRQGPAVSSFPGYQEGDTVPFVAEGIFEYSPELRASQN